MIWNDQLIFFKHIIFILIYTAYTYTCLDYLFVYREQFTLQNQNSVKPWDLQLAKWSPVGHSLAIVDHYNIYYIQDINNLTSIVQLTFTGSSELYNGIPDWVYEGKYVVRLYIAWVCTSPNLILRKIKR